jgi:hypothetical protein
MKLLNLIAFFILVGFFGLWAALNSKNPKGAPAITLVETWNFIVNSVTGNQGKGTVTSPTPTITASPLYDPTSACSVNPIIYA